jgi:hypothetical protein
MYAREAKYLVFKLYTMLVSNYVPFSEVLEHT